MSMTARLRSFPAAELAGLRAQDDLPEEFWDDPDVDLDQAWDVLHHVLSVQAEDRSDSWAASAVLGGAPFGQDQGFGPCRTLSDEEVGLVAAELGAISETEFRRRYAAADLRECYRAQNYDVEGALAAFGELRDCYQQAATAGRAMALFI